MVDAVEPDARRVVIEGVAPCVDGGRFPIKRSCGEMVEVEADIFTDGHDALAAVLRWRAAGEAWSETAMAPLVNDRWQAIFAVDRLCRYEYTLSAWVDHFATWQRGLAKKVAAGQEVSSELLEGAGLVRAAAARASGGDAAWLREWAEVLAGSGGGGRVEAALDEALAAAMARHPDRTAATDLGTVLAVVVERERASAGAWYEMFPRSASPDPARHGTFADVEARLPYVAAMGFDVLYLPPIHPIGRTNRKGPNNTPGAGPDDLGSPWGIGAAEGGHDAIHPALGTLDDFRHLLAAAREQNLEVALDIAFQCSPDHPWVAAHPEWFRHRPDGTVQYAENPPKKYQDIYPLNFESPDWRGLWEELRRVMLHWMDAGVRIFRVDNPHTKPFRFWEWLIAELRRVDPGVIFLSEAFTRPKVMRHLAKAGFSQSYTYFTWRNDKAELTEYLTELTESEVREYLRPNLFANTPDILHAELQSGGRPAFALRFVLAATLGATYGIYGPAFELGEGRALPKSEEYLDSEKYQRRVWALDDPASLCGLIAAVNAARRANPALLAPRSLHFVPTDNEQLIAYGKHTPDLSNLVLTVVNLDPRWPQSGWLELPLEDYGIAPDQPYHLTDLITGLRFTWRGIRNYVALDPARQPAHLFQVTVPTP